MNALTRNLLIGAVLAALPMSHAVACTTGAWASTTGSPIADDPDSNAATNGPTDNGAVPRYSGQCGLQAAAGGTSFVADDSPAGETIYRARFYVYTGNPGATTKIFSALGGTAVERFSASYNPSAGSFTFTPSGSVTGIVANKWYSIEFYYDSAGASTVTVVGNQNTVNSQNVAIGTGTGTVDDIQLGALTAAATANNLRFDEFESTRSTTAAIGRLCRGDANASGNISAGDRSAITGELAGTLASGQPDCNEDGIVSASDRSCITAFLSLIQTPDC
ncbi:MAG TPA: hypothetical protein VFG21_06245 [Xanthomonadaceae bacterium]|nr:hypothetical protein [Xanthomonadaceae bacterium]